MSDPTRVPRPWRPSGLVTLLTDFGLAEGSLSDLHAHEIAVLQDKADESTGKIRVFFNVAGEELEFREWMITGPQGGNTRVVLAGLKRDEKVADFEAAKSARAEKKIS